mmetsp:Transcript_122605/g.381675  ORF Transcript_122605/g.381675 Transcript_122605/m.381675 type:complete len:381 (+) Transcript_122605:196-1338(+)
MHLRMRRTWECSPAASASVLPVLRLLNFLRNPIRGRGHGLPSCDLGSLHHRPHLPPDELLRHVHGARGGGEAAVRAGHDPLHAEGTHVVQDPLGHKPRVLDVRGGSVQHPRKQDLVLGELHLVEDFPLVRVAGVASLQGQELGLGLEDDVSDVRQRHVRIVRPGIVPPADVDPALLRGDVRQSLVQDLDVELGGLPELLHGLVLELRVPAHGEVWAVHLQGQPRGDDALVLRAHGRAERADVGLVRLVVRAGVVEEGGEGAGARRGEEDGVQGLACARGVLLERRHDALDLRLEALEALRRVGDLPVAGGVLHQGLLLQGQEALPALELLGVLGALLEVLRADGPHLRPEPREASPRGAHVIPACQLAVVDDVDAGFQLL